MEWDCPIQKLEWWPENNCKHSK